MNLRNAAVRLHNGMTVAELQPVDVIETPIPPAKEEWQKECIRDMASEKDYRLSVADKDKLSGFCLRNIVKCCRWMS